MAKKGQKAAENLAEVQADKDAKDGGDSKEKKKGGVLSRWLKSGSGPFQNLGPRRGATSVNEPGNVAFNRQTKAFVTYGRRKLNRFSRNDKDKYEASVDVEVDELIPNRVDVLLSSSAGVTLACLGNGKVLVFDEETLELKETIDVPTKSRFKDVDASADGENIVLKCFDKTAWLIKASEPGSVSQLKVGTQGSITAVSFNSDNEIWVGEELGSAACYDLDSSKQLASYSPEQGWLANVYRFFLRPFYWACPKPGEINTLVDHLNSTETAENSQQRNLSRAPRTENPWQPLWSGLVFMGGMLMLSSLLFIRRDY